MCLACSMAPTGVRRPRLTRHLRTCGLSCPHADWYYSMFTLFMLVTFEVTLVTQRLNQMRELRALQTPKQHIQVYR